MATIVTDVGVPADALPFDSLLGAYPDAEVELVRLVPVDRRILPLFWVENADAGGVEETLRADPLVVAVDRLVTTGGRTLYSVDWTPDVGGLVRTLVDVGVEVLSAEGTADGWSLGLQFRSRNDLKLFRQRCRDEGVGLELRELYNPQMPAEKGPLTSEEHDVLATAYENGYWDVPRKTTQGELADLVGVSDETLSKRLRSGVKAVVGELVFGPGGKPYE